mmetsp:Transcript_33340/g.55143  ORF Transcript_33340/g.55143 Transcript_33340/m.55143 type:complete len:214 (+) Transcript_33340:108-749(+)
MLEAGRYHTPWNVSKQSTYAAQCLLLFFFLLFFLSLPLPFFEELFLCFFCSLLRFFFRLDLRAASESLLSESLLDLLLLLPLSLSLTSPCLSRFFTPATLSFCSSSFSACSNLCNSSFSLRNRIPSWTRVSLIAMTSISNSKSALGGTLGGWPFGPYASSAVAKSFSLPPLRAFVSRVSHALITLPVPRVKVNACPRALLESKQRPLDAKHPA